MAVLTLLLAVSAHLGRFIGAIFGHMALLLANAALTTEFARGRGRTIPNHVSFLVAVTTFHDSRIGTVGLVVTRRKDEHGMQMQPDRVDLPFLATVVAGATTSASFSSSVATRKCIKAVRITVTERCGSTSAIIVPIVICGCRIPLSMNRVAGHAPTIELSHAES